MDNQKNPNDPKAQAEKPVQKVVAPVMGPKPTGSHFTGLSSPTATGKRISDAAKAERMKIGRETRAADPYNKRKTTRLGVIGRNVASAADSGARKVGSAIGKMINRPLEEQQGYLMPKLSKPKKGDVKTENTDNIVSKTAEVISTGKSFGGWTDKVEEGLMRFLKGKGGKKHKTPGVLTGNPGARARKEKDTKSDKPGANVLIRLGQGDNTRDITTDDLEKKKKKKTNESNETAPGVPAPGSKAMSPQAQMAIMYAIDTLRQKMAEKKYQRQQKKANRNQEEMNEVATSSPTYTATTAQQQQPTQANPPKQRPGTPMRMTPQQRQRAASVLGSPAQRPAQRPTQPPVQSSAQRPDTRSPAKKAADSAAERRITKDVSSMSPADRAAELRTGKDPRVEREVDRRAKENTAKVDAEVKRRTQTDKRRDSIRSGQGDPEYAKRFGPLRDTDGNLRGSTDYNWKRSQDIKAQRAKEREEKAAAQEKKQKASRDQRLRDAGYRRPGVNPVTGQSTGIHKDTDVWDPEAFGGQGAYVPQGKRYDANKVRTSGPRKGEKIEGGGFIQLKPGEEDPYAGRATAGGGRRGTMRKAKEGETLDPSKPENYVGYGRDASGEYVQPTSTAWE